MKILLIEDEWLVAESLIKLVRELEPTACIDGPLTSVKESKQWLQQHALPDLILSDIQLEDGVSLDIFNDHINCPVIFTTAYDEFAIRAFKVNSIDYLLKPIDKPDLEAAFNKFYLLQSKFSNAAYLRQMTELFNNFNNAQRFKERFAVHIGRSVTLIPVAEIALFLKEEVIYLINGEGKRFITDFRSLDEVQELADPKQFYRVNRQCIAQLHLIESYRTDDTGKVTLKMRNIKTEELIVSKDKAAEFKKWFG